MVAATRLMNKEAKPIIFIRNSITELNDFKIRDFALLS